VKFHPKNLTFKQKKNSISNYHKHLLDVGVEVEDDLLKVDENRTIHSQICILCFETH